MAEEFLGVGFDIHGGGSDLVFPHHENEAAQTRAARGEELARLWMHNGMIQSTGEKMAKSVGNIAPLHEVLARYGPRDGRHVPDLRSLPPAAGVLEAALEQARVQRQPHPRGAVGGCRAVQSPGGHGRLARGVLRCARRRLQHAEGAGRPQRVDPRGRPPRWEVGDSHLREMLGVLGLESLLAADGSGARESGASWPNGASRPARERDFAAADRLRDEIAALGWEVRDGAEGFELISTAA